MSKIGAGPLAGVRVLETACGVAGPYVGKILADLGAEVRKLEPSGGDPTRGLHAAAALGPDGEPLGAPGAASSLFVHLNDAKTIVTAPAGDVPQRFAARAAEAAAGVHVVIDDGALDAAALRRRDPSLVVASLTPFGLDGPYAGYRAEDITLYAMGGPMLATGAAGREPLKLAGYTSTYQWGAVSAVGVLGALARAEATGVGAHLDVSGFETQVGSIDRQVSHLLWWQWTGRQATRPPAGGQAMLPNGYYPCLDGEVAVLMVPTWLDRMLAVLGDDELTRRYAEPNWMADPDLPGLTEAALYVWLASRTKREAMQEAQAARWALTACNRPSDLLSDAHIAERGFLVGQGEATRLRPPLRFHPLDASAGQRSGPGAAAPRIARSPADPDELPLAGVRVLDLTVVWSGPYATMMLADLGADVIRVDNPWVFPTTTRGAVPRPAPEALVSLGPLLGCYPGDEPGERPWNRAGNFVAHSRTKRSVTLDLRRPLGRQRFLELVARSDVVIENNSIDVMAKLGLDPATLAAANPDLIHLRMPSMGLDGPYRNYVGFGFHLEALAGSSLWGYRDGDASQKNPVYPMDPVSGAFAAIGVLAALRELRSGRARSGAGAGVGAGAGAGVGAGGRLVEVPQVEVILHSVGEQVLDAARSGSDAPLLGNRHATHAPQGCYPCRGDDAWLTLCVDSDEAWAALRTVMGGPLWADDERFGSVAGRRAHHDELDERLAAWTVGHDAVELFHRCQAAGVITGPVLDDAAKLADPHLAARGVWRENASAEVPPTPIPISPWRWDGPGWAWGDFCVMGADNDAVLRGLLGLDDAAMAELAADGHLALDYLKADGTPW